MLHAYFLLIFLGNDPPLLRTNKLAAVEGLGLSR